MKLERQKLIKKIITDDEISTQEMLQKRLKIHGLNVTQATISRDIKEMSLVKTLGINGQYKYGIPAKSREKIKSNEELFLSIFLESVEKVDIALNIVVIKTHTGMAQAVCSKLDRTPYPQLVGTLAGDDTIFALMRTENDAIEFFKNLDNLARQVN
ncbi:MAG: arginine repressor [Clostridiales bacterium]|nr:arginine repressor [Clostridiales bacterium]